MASQTILDLTAFASGTEYSSAVRIKAGEPRSIALHLNWSAALSATPIVEVSNDPALHGIVATGGDPSTAEWIDYSSEVTMLSPPAGGAERNGGMNASFFGYEWIRFGLLWTADGPADVLGWLNMVK